MPQPHFEVVLGPIDGANTVFTVAHPYAKNTTAVFVNGILYRRDWDNGWYESDPDFRVVTLKEAPLEGDTVQIFYLDTEPLAPEQEVTSLHGQLHDVSATNGRLLELEARALVVPETGAIDGRLLDGQPVVGALADYEVLNARLREVCH